MPDVWSKTSPKNIYKTPENSNVNVNLDHKTVDLHRRHSNYGLLRERNSNGQGFDTTPSAKPRIYHNLQDKNEHKRTTGGGGQKVGILDERTF